MKKILMVCHGNICRSTMAQFVLQNMVHQQGLSEQFLIDSAGTSREEIGNDVHVGTKQKLREMKIPFTYHAARQVTPKDFESFDYLVGMDHQNVVNMQKMFGNSNKIIRLLDYAKHPRDIADPWYTGNFDVTYHDVVEGCEAFLAYLLSKQ